MADSFSPTHNRTLLCRFTQTDFDSTNLLSIHSILFRPTQSRLDPLRLTVSHSDPLNFILIYSISQRFTELRFLSDSDHIQILSYFIIFDQIHSDFPDAFNLIFVHTRFRSAQIFYDSLVLVQFHSNPLIFTQTGSM